MESTSSINSLFTQTQKIGAFSVPFIQTNLGKITSWARDTNSRDKIETSASRDRDVVFLVETRPRRDVGASQDRDTNTETTSLAKRH